MEYKWNIPDLQIQRTYLVDVSDDKVIKVEDPAFNVGDVITDYDGNDIENDQCNTWYVEEVRGENLMTGSNKFSYYRISGEAELVIGSKVWKMCNATKE